MPPPSPARRTPAVKSPLAKSHRLRVKGTVLGQAVVLVVIGGLVFFPVLSGGWLWGDEVEVSGNPLMRTWSGLAQFWLHPADAGFLPAKSTAQWLLWRLWGRSPGEFHLVNLALHVLGSLLLWRVFWKLGLRFAWFGALLFLVHPLTVESVAWIAQFKNPLALPALLLAFSAWMAFEENRRWPAYVAALGCFGLALLSNNAVIFFPGVLLLYCWWKRRRLTAREGRAVIPFLALSGLVGALVLLTEPTPALAESILFLEGAFSHFADAGLSILFYVAQALWPLDLQPFYPSWGPGYFPLAAVLAWIVIFGVLIALGLRRAVWGRAVLFGLGTFLLLLLPALGFLTPPRLATSALADHLAYLPLVGLIALALAAAQVLADRLPRRARPVLAAAAVAVVLVFAGQTFFYALIFQNPQRLWTYALHHNPEAWRAHDNLGVILLQQDHDHDALTHFTVASRLNPADFQIQSHLGNAYAKVGQFPAAIEYFNRALAGLHDSAELRHNFGIVLVRSGRTAEAVEQFDAAIKLDPNFAEALTDLGHALILAHLPAKSIPYLEKSVLLKPGFVAGHYNLGLAYSMTNRPADAATQFELVLRQQPDNADVRAALARARQQAQSMAANPAQ